MVQLMAYMDGILKEISPNEASRFEIIAKVDRDRKTLQLVIPEKCSMITRRTAERQARSVAKSNFCDFILEETDDVTTVLKEKPLTSVSSSPEIEESSKSAVVEQSAPESIVTQTPSYEPLVTKSQVPKPEVPRPQVSESEVPRPQVSESEVPRPRISEPEVPRPQVSESEVPKPPISEPEVPKPQETERDYVDRFQPLHSSSPPTSGQSKIISEAIEVLGFDKGDFIASLFLWQLLVNTIKVDNVVKIGDTITMQWDDGSAVEFMVEDNKRLSNLLVLNALGRKANMIKQIWKSAMKWQKFTES